MQYIYNTVTELWYEVTAIVNDVGETSLSVSPSGIANPSETIPLSGDPLVSIEEYQVILNVSSVTNYTQWLYAALGTSDFVERACNYSWRTEGVSVPVGLKLIVCQAIRDQLDYLNGKVNATKKSESITNYSFSLADNIKCGSILSQYEKALEPYSVVAFCYFDSTEA